MPTAEQVRAAVDTYVESFVARDKERFLAAFSADVEQIDPVGSPPNHGVEALSSFWDTVFAAAERLEFDVRDIIVAGDEAALAFHITQHFVGGGGLVIDGIDIFRVNDQGRINSVKGYVDQAHVQQLTS